MASNRKNAVVNILLRSATVIYLIVLGILLVPMYLKYIPVELYGYWLASGNIIAWIGDFAPVGIVMQQKVGLGFGAKDYKLIGEYIGTSIIISLLITLILLIGLVIFYQLIFGWLGINDAGFKEKLQYTIIYAGTGTLLTLVSFGFSGVNYGLQLFKAVGFLNLGTNLACIIATWLLLPHYGLYALGLALLVRGFLNLTGNVIILWNFLRKSGVKIQFSKSQTRKLFGDVSFNFFSRIGNLLSKNSQLFFITKFITPEAAVMFKFTKTVPEISKFFTAVPAEAIMPVFSKYLGQKPHMDDVKMKILKMINYSIWGTGLIAIGFAILNKIFITLWVGESFYAGNAVNMIIVLWVVVSSITNNLMYTVFALGDIRKNNVAVFIQSIVFILLMLLMVRPWGIIGIALALVVSETIISLTYYPWSLHKYVKFSKKDVMYFMKELGVVCIIISLIYILAHNMHFFPKSWYGFMVYTVLVTASYLIGLFLTSSHFKTEMNHMLIRLKTMTSKKQYSLK